MNYLIKKIPSSLFIALSLALSIGFAKINKLILIYYAIILILFTLVLYLKLKNKFLIYICLLSICFSILGIFRFFYLESNYKKLKSDLENKTFDIEAIVLENKSNNSLIYKYLLKLEVAKTVNTKILKENYIINIFLKQNYELKVGDKILIKNLTLINKKNKNLELYLKKENILFSLFLNNFDFSIIQKSQNYFYNWLIDYRNNLISKITKKMDNITSLLFESIFLGIKQNNLKMEKIREKLTDWGISHYLARSGLHVALFILLWIFIFRFIPLNYFIKQIIITILIIVYNILTYSSISFERAYITYLFYRLCTIQILPIHSLHLISLTTISILIYNPYQLFFLDFQLSFASTYALILFNESKFYIKR